MDLRLCMNYVLIPRPPGSRNEIQNEFTDFSPELVLHVIFPLNCDSFPGQNSCGALLLDRVNPLLCKLIGVTLLMSNVLAPARSNCRGKRPIGYNALPAFHVFPWYVDSRGQPSTWRPRGKLASSSPRPSILMNFEVFFRKIRFSIKNSKIPEKCNP